MAKKDLFRTSYEVLLTSSREVTQDLDNVGWVDGILAMAQSMYFDQADRNVVTQAAASFASIFITIVHLRKPVDKKAADGADISNATSLEKWGDVLATVKNTKAMLRKKDDSSVDFPLSNRSMRLLRVVAQRLTSC